jgi:hypothetical protein
MRLCLNVHFHLQSPNFANPKTGDAGVAKLVDVSDLGSDAARHGGSSPSTRTGTVNSLLENFIS